MKWGKLFKIILLDYSRQPREFETAKQVRRSFVVGVGWVSSVKRRRPWAFFSETASFYSCAGSSSGFQFELKPHRFEKAKILYNWYDTRHLIKKINFFFFLYI